MKSVFLLSFFLVFSFSDVDSVRASVGSEVSYRNGTIYFFASKSGSKLRFTDHLGARDLEIKTCNRDLVDSFWKNITDSVASLKFAKVNKKKIPAGSAKLKFEGIEFPILSFEPARQEFNRVPEKYQALLLESLKKCAK